MKKMYVRITAEHNINGTVSPTILHWEDGRKWPIEKVLDRRMSAALKVGGQGLRYRCRIAGKTVELYCDDGRWFLEIEEYNN